MMLEGAIFIAECYNEHARVESSLLEVKNLLKWVKLQIAISSPFI